MSQVLIDNSMLSDIYACSTRTWLKYIQHKQMRKQDGSERERMEVGKLFHGLFERCLQGMSIGENTSYLGARYAEVFKDGVEEEKYDYHNLLVIAETWLRHNSTYFRDYSPLCIEQYLEMPLCGDVTFFGTLDSVVENSRGELWIVESKTTGDIGRNKLYWSRGSQGMGYWELVKYHFGREPKGVLWNTVEIRKIPPYDGKMSKKCQKHKVKYEECQSAHVKMEMIGPIAYRPEQLALWRTQAIEGAGRFGALLSLDAKGYYAKDDPWPLSQEGKFTYPGCSRCEFGDWCWSGRPLALMSSMMESYTWPRVEEKEVTP